MPRTVSTPFVLLPEFEESDRLTARDALRIGAMYGRHGKAAVGLRCKSCAHFTGRAARRGRWSKCLQYGVSGCQASDWNGRWPACGRWEVKP